MVDVNAIKRFANVNKLSITEISKKVGISEAEVHSIVYGEEEDVEDEVAEVDAEVVEEETVEEEPKEESVEEEKPKKNKSSKK